MILPSCQVHDTGEFTWAPSASVLVVPHMLINPQHPHACEAGGVIRCGLQTRLDMGPHGIPRGCQLSSQSCNGCGFLSFVSLHNFCGLLARVLTDVTHALICPTSWSSLWIIRAACVRAWDRRS